MGEVLSLIVSLSFTARIQSFAPGGPARTYRHCDTASQKWCFPKRGQLGKYTPISSVWKNTFTGGPGRLLLTTEVQPRLTAHLGPG